MARQLARDHGAHLVLVGRRADRLALLEAELCGYGGKVKILPADLGSTAGVDAVFRHCTQQVPLYAAVLNAGVTHFGHHDELTWEQFEALVDLNIKGTARLVHDLVPYLERRAEQGGILLVASLAGVTPVAYQSAYSGSKAFLVHYGCSLHHEMRSRGVTVSTFAPGGIATEMTQGARFNDLRSWLVPVQPCARAALRGFAKRKYLIIPGVVYRFGSWLLKFFPESFVVGRVAAQYRNSLTKSG